MSVLESKEKPIDKIRHTDDEALLKELSNLFALQEADSRYEFTEKQQQALTEARSQIKSGDCLTDKKADKEIDQWLNG